jgi:hypothetical protein
MFPMQVLCHLSHAPRFCFIFQLGSHTFAQGTFEPQFNSASGVAEITGVHHHVPLSQGHSGLFTYFFLFFETGLTG